MGVGAFPETHELSLRWLGMHGSAYANGARSGEFEKDAEGKRKRWPREPTCCSLLACGLTTA
ncbi:MAG: hypothetical protein CM1200mP29_08770 [Verrucomicrobiota bacterium]|nr:MAG: hypothetical protein CM1200mP29_08770 [Verrucomicrobiota bacterium]